MRSTCRSSDDSELEADGNSMIGGVSHIRRAEEGEQFAESRLGERVGGTDDGPARGDWRGLRVHVEVPVLVEPRRVRNDEDGEAVNDV